MMSMKGAIKDRLGLPLESYLAAIRLTQDQATLGELEDQLESDERLCRSDGEFLRSFMKRGRRAGCRPATHSRPPKVRKEDDGKRAGNPRRGGARPGERRS